MAATERLDLRCTREQKTLVQTAAGLRGLSVTKFALNALLTEARETIQKQSEFELSLADQAFFVEQLLNPPAPGDRLREAYDKYRRNVG